MRIKRFAPLINLLYGLVGIGEFIGRVYMGDAKGAQDSLVAGGMHIFYSILPYYSAEGDEINSISRFINLVMAL